MSGTLNFQDFVPDLVIEQATSQDTQTGPTRCKSSEAMVLFVDMSGFSQLAADFVTHSERGAEGLREQINAVFNIVVSSITEHGGSLLYYAGDAVTAVWPATPLDLSASIHTAIACGLDIQEKCKTLPALWNAQRTQMKAMLHHGPLWIVDAAMAQNARQALLCGGVLEGLSSLPETKSYEGVALSETLFGLLAKDIPSVNAAPAAGQRLVTAITSPAAAGAVTKDAGIDLSAYIHPHLQRSLSIGSQDWLAEFRAAHVLFMRVSDFKFSSETALTTTENMLKAMHGAVQAQGGTLMQICNDDKGVVCIAAWGLAHSSFENDAARAVLAAQSIAQTLAELGMNANGAVTYGKIFAGLLGAKPLLQYSIVGDVLSRAASMTGKNLAAVVLDEATQSNLPSEFSCEDLGQMRLKGQSAAISIFAPAGQKVKSTYHEGALVGRTVERSALTERLDKIASGEAGDIRIFAGAGLGKSRLAAWFEDQAHDKKLRVLRMNADQLRQSSSYLPLRQVFDHLFDWPADVQQLSCIDRLDAMFKDDPVSRGLLPLLNPILPVELDENEQTRSLIGAGRAELARTTIVAVLQRLLDEKNNLATLLLIEDAHWLDSASWLCIEAAKRDITGLSLMIVARPIDEDQIPTEVKKLIEPDTGALDLSIGPLSREDTAAIVCQSLHVSEVTSQITDLVFREAAGHPLYTTALAAALNERGLIRITKDYAHLHLGDASVSDIAFPQGVKGVISERISALDAQQQLLIKTAAVLGRNFDLETLAAVYPIADRGADLEALLDGLVTVGLIEKLDVDRYRFHHAIITDCAHEMLTSQQQHALHAIAGTKIEADVNAQDHAPEQTQLALLAYHFEHANDPEKAVPYLAQAAGAARRGYGNVEAVDFLSRALFLSEHGAHATPLQRSTWHVQIAESLRALGQYQRAESFLKTAIATLETPAPQTAMRALGQLLREFAKFKLRPHKPRQPDTIRAPIITAADANMMLSEIHYELNKIPFALSEILKGANLARKAGGDSETLAKLYIGMALISTSLPWALDGDDLQQKALDIADRLEDPATPSWVYMVSGVYETGKGRWQSGADHLNHSREMAEHCGERKTWETAMSCLGNLKRLEGWFEDAKGWSDLTMQASLERGIDHGVIWSHNGRARDLLCLSHFDELRADVAALERMLNDPTKTGDSNDNNNLVLHYAAAFCALQDRDDTRAKQEFAAVIKILAEIKRPQVYMIQNVDYYSDIIWALWHRGHRDAGLMEQHKLVLKSGKQVAKQYRTGAPMASLALGDAAWFKGNAEEAQKHWQASVDYALELGMLYNAAHALFRMEQVGLEAGDWRVLTQQIGIERPLIWAFDL